MHYERLRKYGDVNTTKQVRAETQLAPCAVEGCKLPSYALEMCSVHYQRWRRHGDVTKRMRSGPLPKSGKHGRYLTTHGYISTYRNDVRILEHRMVMEEILGRTLLKSESVHHMNGIRDDNRPENLELWVRSQPPGTRVADQIEWAIELIERYSPISVRANSFRR